MMYIDEKEKGNFFFASNPPLLKFIDPSETAVLNTWRQGFLRGLRSIPFLHVLISILFTVIWIDVIVKFPGLFILGLILPIVLLIGVLQYKSKYAYGAVLALFIFALLQNLISIPNYIDLIWIHPERALMFSACMICELQTNLELMTVAMVGISLLHTKRLV